ncbi:hypothetical protein K3495_g2783 [Podosphaera aphanis]|nr:hypothetical protein K3495_g2783 [Podosphaera aphanis]
MHTTSSRAQNVFGFFTSVALIIAGLIATTDLISPRTPSAEVSLIEAHVNHGKPHYYSRKREEYAVIRFSLTADLSSLFTWNTKQVFVYVSAAWPNSTSTVLSNEAVIWDSIITNPSADHLLNVGPATLKKLIRSSKGLTIDPRRGKLVLKNQKAKYHVTFPTGKLSDTKNVVLTLNYNVQPWVGALTWTPQIEFGGWKKVKGGATKPFRLSAPRAKSTSKV